MTRNDSLGPLHLEGFDEIQTGHWTLENDGHSGECTLPTRPWENLVFYVDASVAAPSYSAGRQRHGGERRGSSRCVLHRPAALPLGRPGHQRLRAHGGRTQIPDGGTVRSVGSSAVSARRFSEQSRCSHPLTSLFLKMSPPDAHSQHEVYPSQHVRGFGRPNRTRRTWLLYRCR